MNLSTPENLAVIDHLLSTTRSVRKRLDFSRPVERKIIEECIEFAIQAPTASNRQNWHFMVVMDVERRAAIAAIYRKSFDAYIQPALRWTQANPKVARDQGDRVRDSAIYLAEHMHEAPALIIPCFEGRVETAPAGAQAASYGSILPATWSLMLALRSRGIGAAWTTLHLSYEQEVAQNLGIPETITQAALLPIAYFTGDDFKPAERIPAAKLTHWNSW
jgi:nitroreductase